jgi:hypothetical protein
MERSQAAPEVEVVLAVPLLELEEEVVPLLALVPVVLPVEDADDVVVDVVEVAVEPELLPEVEVELFEALVVLDFPEVEPVAEVVVPPSGFVELELEQPLASAADTTAKDRARQGMIDLSWKRRTVALGESVGKVLGGAGRAPPLMRPGAACSVARALQTAAEHTIHGRAGVLG